MYSTLRHSSQIKHQFERVLKGSNKTGFETIAEKAHTRLELLSLKPVFTEEQLDTVLSRYLAPLGLDALFTIILISHKCTSGDRLL